LAERPAVEEDWGLLCSEKPRRLAEQAGERIGEMKKSV
jgi:hypothetical protein